MFIVKKLEEALLTLLAASLESEEEAEEVMAGIDMDALTQALCHAARTVYAYELDSACPLGMKYRGEELFGQRAALLCRENEECGSDIITTSRILELWALEDNSLVLCSAVELDIGKDDYAYQSTYRVVKGNPLYCNTGIDPDEIVAALEELCYPVFESEIPFYDL